MNNRQVVVTDLLATYSIAGKGPSILCLHGWGDEHTTFKNVSSALENDYTVIAVDLPGFGKTQAPEKAWDLDNYAEFVRDFLSKIKQQSLFAVIAHSNGGSIAIRGIAEGKIDTEKLILLGSAGIRDRQKTKKLAYKAIAKTGKVSTFFLPISVRHTLRKKLYNYAGSDMFVAPGMEETYKLTIRQDVQKDAGHLHLPTLLIYGENDTATPPEYGKIYKHLIGNSKLQIIGRAGHFIHHDQAEQTIQVIRDFLKK